MKTAALYSLLVFAVVPTINATTTTSTLNTKEYFPLVLSDSIEFIPSTKNDDNQPAVVITISGAKIKPTSRDWINAADWDVIATINLPSSSPSIFNIENDIISGVNFLSIKYKRLVNQDKQLTFKSIKNKVLKPSNEKTPVHYYQVLKLGRDVTIALPDNIGSIVLHSVSRGSVRKALDATTKKFIRASSTLSTLTTDLYYYGNNKKSTSVDDSTTTAISKDGSSTVNSTGTTTAVDTIAVAKEDTVSADATTIAVANEDTVVVGSQQRIDELYLAYYYNSAASLVTSYANRIVIREGSSSPSTAKQEEDSLSFPKYFPLSVPSRLSRTFAAQFEIYGAVEGHRENDEVITWKKFHVLFYGSNNKRHFQSRITLEENYDFEINLFKIKTIINEKKIFEKVWTLQDIQPVMNDKNNMVLFGKIGSAEDFGTFRIPISVSSRQLARASSVDYEVEVTNAVTNDDNSLSERFSTMAFKTLRSAAVYSVAIAAEVTQGNMPDSETEKVMLAAMNQFSVAMASRSFNNSDDESYVPPTEADVKFHPIGVAPGMVKHIRGTEESSKKCALYGTNFRKKKELQLVDDDDAFGPLKIHGNQPVTYKRFHSMSLNEDENGGEIQYPMQFDTSFIRVECGGTTTDDSGSVTTTMVFALGQQNEDGISNVEFKLSEELGSIIVPIQVTEAHLLRGMTSEYKKLWNPLAIAFGLVPPSTMTSILEKSRGILNDRIKNEGGISIVTYNVIRTTAFAGFEGVRQYGPLVLKAVCIL